MPDVWTVERHGVELSVHQDGGKIAGCWKEGAFYEEGLLQHIYRELQAGAYPGKVAIDAGAHIGNHTLWLAGVCGLEVHAFEPFYHDKLQANVELNGLSDRVTCYPHPLGDGSELPHIVIGGRRKGADVPTVRLDSFSWEDVAIVKIDTDQAEIPVLEGALGLLLEHEPVVFIEQMKGRDPIAEILEPLEYRQYKVHNRRRGVNPVVEWRPSR